MKQQTLIFLKPFSINKPTLDEQNDFMMTEVVTEVECANLGKIYNNDMLYGKDLAVFIPEEVEVHNPQWIVAVGQCATVALNIRNQKKVLLNPKVNYDHLNNVSEFDREHTLDSSTTGMNKTMSDFRLCFLMRHGFRKTIV